MANNFSFDVFEKIDTKNRHNWKLYIDAVYNANPAKKDKSAEVLSKLLGVKNSGGFRYLGKTETPNLVVLWSTGEDIYWKDEIDTSLGTYLYYGDNKTPGKDLHKTSIHGNEILRYIFTLAESKNFNDRKRIPPVLVFQKECGWNVKFLGLAVPGVKEKPKKEWLTAVWGCDKESDRFQNYKAYFTILDTASGSESEEGYGINLAWLNDIVAGNAFDSIYAPKSWKQYIQNEIYTPLISKVHISKIGKDVQMPQEPVKKKMLATIHKYFIDKDRGYSFEAFARDMVKYMDNSVVKIETTRPFKDGGFDAVGQYRIFNNVDNFILVDFYMQAKCYAENNSVKVTDTARLISRIKNRQFGIMVTTSYIADQAYKEVKEDGHPIVFINGKNIIDYIYDELEIRSDKQLLNWLIKNY